MCVFRFFFPGMVVVAAETDVTGRRIAGARGSHGGVHEADDPCAPGGSVVAGAVARRRAASGGGDRRVHDSAHRRHHLAHRVRHELRYREAHLPSPRGPAAPHGELQPPPLDPRQPVSDPAVSSRHPSMPAAGPPLIFVDLVTRAPTRSRHTRALHCLAWPLSLPLSLPMPACDLK